MTCYQLFISVLSFAFQDVCYILSDRISIRSPRDGQACPGVAARTRLRPRPRRAARPRQRGCAALPPSGLLRAADPGGQPAAPATTKRTRETTADDLAARLARRVGRRSAWALELVAVPSVNGTADEAAFAEWLRDRLAGCRRSRAGRSGPSKSPATRSTALAWRRSCGAGDRGRWCSPATSTRCGSTTTATWPRSPPSPASLSTPFAPGWRRAAPPRPGRSAGAGRTSRAGRSCRAGACST
jgi:hypothetical protein